MGVKSGVPAVVNGVKVGATDFSEFTVGAGLPAGITGLGVIPANVSINDAPVSPSFTDEGKYFEMPNPITFNVLWAFTVDAFDGILEQGELLARIFCNFNGLQNRRCIGPGMSLTDIGNLNGAVSGFQDAFTSGDVEISGGRFVGGGIGTIGFFSIQEPLQEDEWMWLRVRKVPNAGSPSNDDWTVTAWYGDLEDEPASPDGVLINVSPTAPRGLFGIGWGYMSPGATGDQRIAYLSYSENPAVEPPPIPPLGGTIWTPFPEVFLRNSPKPAIIGSEIEYDVRVLILNDGDDVDVWPDSSGQGNDLLDDGSGRDPAFIEDGWAPGINAVRFQDVPGDEQERMVFDGTTPFSGTEVTFFLVFEATNLEDGCAVLGSSNGATPPRIWDLSVDSDGTIFFNHQETPRLVNSAVGVIEEGGRYIVTGRMSNTLGMVLRVNGLEVGRNETNTAKQNIVDYPGASIGQSRDLKLGDTEYGKDKLIVWVGGYSVAASDEQIEQMESFLSALFELPFGTQWTDQPEVSPGTVWANIS